MKVAGLSVHMTRMGKNSLLLTICINVPSLSLRFFICQGPESACAVFQPHLQGDRSVCFSGKYPIDNTTSVTKVHENPHPPNLALGKMHVTLRFHYNRLIIRGQGTETGVYV